MKKLLSELAIGEGGKILSGGGASPFSVAKKAGFEGTEAEFNELLANIDEAATKEELESAINSIPTPDVSSQISEHNLSNNAHPYIQGEIFNELQNGTTVVKAAEHDSGNNKIVDTYETKTDANTKLSNAKDFATQEANRVKNELLNGAGVAYDTLKELGDLIDENHDAIDALEIVATNKVDKVDVYTKAEVDSLTLITPEDIDIICSATTGVNVVTLNEGVF